MKKIALVFCFFGWIASDLNAQSNVVASGGNASGSGGSVSYSVGQIDYTTKTGTGGMLTEGVQQPFEILVITGLKEDRINLNAVVFPNPASDYVELHVHDGAKYPIAYELVDLNGKTIAKDLVAGNSTRISLTSISGGVYYLKVSSDNKLIKTFQINSIK